MHCDSRVQTVCGNVMELPREKIKDLSPQVLIETNFHVFLWLALFLGCVSVLFKPEYLFLFFISAFFCTFWICCASKFPVSDLEHTLAKIAVMIMKLQTTVSHTVIIPFYYPLQPYFNPSCNRR
ncbi:unnamed protein product [Cuscuta epithymum]|uniref:Uncharacterized protein n=1 Tax=Cuscuta epithymum TaxID=186058 RepID=A0AAV0ETD5_9ASTE|nr:unnamed protein product [Cuscuta epithymum]